MKNNVKYLGLAVLTALVSIIIADNATTKDLELLCDDQPVKLLSISQVRSLIEKLQHEPEVKCSKSVRRALLDVMPVIEREDACSDNKFEEISKFHATYLSERSKRRKNLPAALRRFVIAYALRVSNVCKDSMADHLFEDGSEFDVEVFNSAFESQKGFSDKLKNVVGDALNYNSLILSGIVTSARSRSKKKKIATKNVESIRSIQEICKNKLEPHYRKYIVPVSRLAGLGFDYASEKLAQVNKEKWKELEHWYKTMVICESALSIEVVESRDHDGALSVLPDEQTQEVPTVGQIDTHVPSQIVSLPDRVLDESDKVLNDAIENIKLDPSKEQLKDLARRSLKSFKTYVSSKKIKFFHSKQDNKTPLDIKTNLIRNKRADTNPFEKRLDNPFLEAFHKHIRKIREQNALMNIPYSVYAVAHIAIELVLLVIIGIIVYAFVIPGHFILRKISKKKPTEINFFPRQGSREKDDAQS